MRKSKRRKVPKTKEKNDIQTTRASALFGKAPTHEVLENLLAGVESRRIGGWQIAELEVQAWKKKVAQIGARVGGKPTHSKKANVPRAPASARSPRVGPCCVKRRDAQARLEPET
jgi:hypothetical protein